mmetsp:Transcript_93687/g.291948  ORF Transcript_93687/g.291948 Transcript_93687/m.291948 type:complete len:276 (+) Transcript_93687:1608-2435(+)
MPSSILLSTDRTPSISSAKVTSQEPESGSFATTTQTDSPSPMLCASCISPGPLGPLYRTMPFPQSRPTEWDWVPMGERSQPSGEGGACPQQRPTMGAAARVVMMLTLKKAVSFRMVCTLLSGFAETYMPMLSLPPGERKSNRWSPLVITLTMMSFTCGRSMADFCSEPMNCSEFRSFIISQEAVRRLSGGNFFILKLRSRLNFAVSSSSESSVAGTSSTLSGCGTPAPLNSISENLGMQRRMVSKSTVWKNQSSTMRSAISFRHSSSTMQSTFLT